MRIEMQKLEKRNTYTPLGASQAQSPVAVSLNREETLGEHSLKTFSNSLDVNLQSGKTGQDLRVPVLNMRGKPLMPTTPAKARHLIKQGKAKAVKRKPFVIQLTIATGETKQDITLGVDSGYSHVGFSAVTEKQELISGELQLRKDMSKLIEQKRNYRITRRSKLWHRQPRFNNRTRKDSWLAPSIQHKLDTHIRLIEKIKKWFPITNTVIEVANIIVKKVGNVGEGATFNWIATKEQKVSSLHLHRFVSKDMKYIIPLPEGLATYNKVVAALNSKGTMIITKPLQISGNSAIWYTYGIVPIGNHLVYVELLEEDRQRPFPPDALIPSDNPQEIGTIEEEDTGDLI